jgi:hypothetical protein
MSTWQTPEENWGEPGQTVPGADDFNRIEGNTKFNHDINKVITAGGTGTAITLTTGSSIALAAGLKLFFRATADNGGVATTITIDGSAAKHLYRPGGTNAPTVEQDNVYFIWYDSGEDAVYLDDKHQVNAEEIAAHKSDYVSYQEYMVFMSARGQRRLV